MEGSRCRKKILCVDNEKVVLLNVERRGWPTPVNTENLAGEAGIGVDIVDRGEVPPDFDDICVGSTRCSYHYYQGLL
jgi:hypothetical protein